jgi:hypothetical protein
MGEVQGGQRSAGTRVRVPALPPDSVPAALWKQIHAPPNMISTAPQGAAPFPRDIIVVAFRQNATQAERQVPIEAIGGEVIGGEPVDRGGYYYVRIHRDGTAEALFQAIKTLKGFRQVEIASPEPPAIHPH